MVPKSFLSGLIYSTRCEYVILKVLKEIDQNPPIGCAKFLGFLVVCHLCWLKNGFETFKHLYYVIMIQ